MTQLAVVDTGIRLDLGCGENCPPGWIGLDARSLADVDIVWDAEDFPWPLDDESVAAARASHLVEHINPAKYGFIKFMDEAWRVLRVDGEFAISCPHGSSPAFIQDPTHINPINETTWQYFDPLAPTGAYRHYRPQPWEIKSLSTSTDGIMDVILVKRAEAESYDKLIPESPTEELTSLIVLTFNGLEHTKRCLDSIQAYTPEPYELIIVDNASTDGTVEFLREYSEKHEAILVIANRRNRGFAGGMNQGIGAAKGGVVVLMNNDLIVTEGWLPRLHEPFRQFPDCGLVGPMSNFVSGPQLVKDAPYVGDGAEMRKFSAQWARAHRGQTVSTIRLVGFCLAIHRDVIEAIGGLDERFFPGNYEDDDYCLRAIMAGFEARIARSAFVHHVGHVGFSSDGVDLGTALSDNQRRFRAKWGMPEKIPANYNLKLPPFERARHYHPLPVMTRRPTRVDLDFEPAEPVKDWPSISLVMIVRDEENNLDDCLESIGDLCNETIIVDTGSTDETTTIALAAGAKLLSFEWCDDFAAARNHGLEAATGEWIFWMDADDRLDDENRERLKLAVASGAADAFCCKIDSFVNGLANQSVTTTHARLFRNVPEARFRFAIHEDVTPSIIEAGLSLAYTNIAIEHTGYARSTELRVEKARRNRDILLRELAADPENMRLRYHLGVTQHIMGDIAGATEHLRMVVNSNAPVLGRSDLHQAYLLLITGLDATGHPEESADMLERALFAHPDNRHLTTLAAARYINAGQIDEALAAIDKAEALPLGPMRWPDGILDEYRKIIRKLRIRQGLRKIAIKLGLHKAKSMFHSVGGKSWQHQQ